MKAREQQHQQQLQMQQLQLMQQRNAQLQRRDPNHSPIGGPINAINSEGMMGQPSASVLAMKMYEERMKHPQSMDSETSSALMDPNRMALLKSASNHQGYDWCNHSMWYCIILHNIYLFLKWNITSIYLLHDLIESFVSLFLLCWFSQLLQGNSGNMSAALQQLQGRSQLATVTTWALISWQDISSLLNTRCFIFSYLAKIHTYFNYVGC